MTAVYVCLESGMPVRVKIKGHSGFADAGYDIVCAAISAVSQTAALGLERLVPGAYIKIDESRSALTIDIGNRYRNGEDFDRAQLIVTTMLYGIEDIGKQYPEFVKITKADTEVKTDD
jgi:uncharacterized protein YsxB (DUF464 family)